MNYQEESREELIYRLQESEKVNAGLKVLYENSINKLKEEEELFEKTFSTSSDAILLTRLEDGYFVYINNAFTELTGYTVGDISDKTTLDINLWQDPTQRNIFTKELNTTGIFNNFEIIFRRKDKSLFTALLSAKYVMFQGTPHILSILRDLTETKHTQELLKESEEKYKLLVDNAIEAIVVICESSLT
ncbi:MAG: PAS domain-containing protein, partial [Bacteroidota bacterium]|nr:PAS domain-containing protein [Bacteroidota bacterium]